ncbi:MAG: dihydroorotate dehydrogenase electron transfer subunit [Sulfobacillus acidophilus]|uniref:Dihydroorotate dehydrogenase electron transfer subunit n=1 Tax=Sulfobacillus acidophilus TaxID=53633 RepID=A0A2T2WFG2_9FIRM|nr:MAG: dihydroorotate dehydrogenase electron transfer subunit [Sulfobacillus acidophilus]
MKRDYDVVVVQRRVIAPQHVELIVESPDLASAQPGQFAHVLTPGMLRRPISFSRIDRAHGQVGLIVQSVGIGTEWLCNRQAGDRLNVLGPLGRGFSPPEAGQPWALVGGGVGIPPLYAALQAWQNTVHVPQVVVILGARAAAYLIMADDFGRLGVEVRTATDDGSAGQHGTVLSAVTEWMGVHREGQMMACGPTAMLQAVYQVTANWSGRTQLALEQRMGCGIGACLACVVATRSPGTHGSQYQRVCTEGPVFDREELVFS